MAENCREQLDQAVQIAEKLERQNRVDEIKDQMLSDLEERFPEGEKELKAAFRALEKELIRTGTLNEVVRMD